VKDKQMQTFIDKHIKKVKPLRKKAFLAYWDAAVSGSADDYNSFGKLQLSLRQIYSDPNDFAWLKQTKESGRVTDPIQARQLDLLYNAYLENQIEPDLLRKIVELGAEVEKSFSTSRGSIDGQTVTNNQIKDILKNETDSAKRQKAWLAGKQVGPVVADDVIRLVKLRNQAARKLGFDNFHSLSLTIAEQNIDELNRIFEQLYRLTNEPFAALKSELDGILANKYGLAVGELQPWHYHDQFFQEAPLVYDVDLDNYYKDKDVISLARQFYAGIGLPVDDILQRSDLYEKDGKNPHAFCTNIDRMKDIRILCNVKNNEYWMETMLHELGHAVYEKNFADDVPYLLREPAHIFTTEAIAMFFGRLSRNPAWMQQMLGLSGVQRSDIEKVALKYARLKQLIFARWAMVMYDFEKQMYGNPDQDLNRLWWLLVEKYQLIKAPAGRNQPDWAAKIHFTISPCYYHNYMLGELLASQLHNYLVHDILKPEKAEQVSYVDRKDAGEYLKKNIFEPATIYRWDKMIERATGEPLNPKYFVQQFVK
jgi:peptidyl-dipeptidase A